MDDLEQLAGVSLVTIIVIDAKYSATIILLGEVNPAC